MNNKGWMIEALLIGMLLFSVLLIIALLFSTYTQISASSKFCPEGRTYDGHLFYYCHGQAFTCNAEDCYFVGEVKPENFYCELISTGKSAYTRCYYKGDLNGKQ